MKQIDVVALRVAMATPFIYFGLLALASLFYPGYSQMRQAAAELGAKWAPHPAIYNFGVVILGFALLIGALGFFRALQHLGTNPVLTWLTSSVLALYGAGALMAGFFPLPDSRHNGFYLFYAIFFGPGLFAITLWNRRDSRLLKGYLITTNILMIATYVVIMGIGGFVTRTNVGLFLRINALAALPWITVAACSLKQSAASRTSLS